MRVLGVIAASRVRVGPAMGVQVAVVVAAGIAEEVAVAVVQVAAVVAQGAEAQAMAPAVPGVQLPLAAKRQPRKRPLPLLLHRRRPDGPS